MHNNVREAKAVYLKHKGWFWVVPEGQKSLYFGPYKNEEAAKTQGPADDLADQKAGE